MQKSKPQLLRQKRSFSTQIRKTKQQTRNDHQAERIYKFFNDDRAHPQTDTRSRGERNKEKFGLKTGKKREICSEFEFRDPHT